MSDISQTLAFEFSSSERRKGETLFRDRAVMLSSTNDTYVSANVRSSTPGRVTLSSEDVGGSLIKAKCSCAVYQKNELCRHIWAVVLKLENHGSDFLEGKSEIALESATTTRNEDAIEDVELTPRQIEFQEKREAYKEKQKALAKEYRKQQSEKHKEIRKQRSVEHKEIRKQRQQARASDELFEEALRDQEHVSPGSDKKQKTPVFQYPQLVEKARQFFQANGFAMKQPMTMAELIEAKKHLSRVFHPDKGGSHEEILEVNRNFQIINDYLKS